MPAPPSVNINSVSQAPIVDPQTGILTRNGYYFLLWLFGQSNSNATINDLQLMGAMDASDSAQLSTVAAQQNSLAIASAFGDEYDAFSALNSAFSASLERVVAAQAEFNPGPMLQRINDTELVGVLGL